MVAPQLASPWRNSALTVSVLSLLRISTGGVRNSINVLNFYKCYLAYVRGKVESFKLADPHISEEEKTGILAIARSYFGLAESHI